MLETRTHEAHILAEQLLGTVDDVIHQPYGHAGIIFEICTQTGDFILKTRDVKSSFDHTEHHIEVLENLDVPTPTMLKLGNYEMISSIPACYWKAPVIRPVTVLISTRGPVIAALTNSDAHEY